MKSNLKQRERRMAAATFWGHTMKPQTTSYWNLMLALSGLLSLSGTALGHDGMAFRIAPEQTARWWQWALSIPSSVHPLSQKNTDPTGADYCMVGQQGDEWFLGGVFKSIDVEPEANPARGTANDVVPIEIERQCNDIPLGKVILIPVLNAECDTAEELAWGNDVPDDLFGKVRFLKHCVKPFAEAIDTRTISASFGPEGQPLKRVEVERVRTTLPFSVRYAPDNIMSSNCSGPEADRFLCQPDPNPALAQSDGYWAQVRPLQPGRYILQTFGEAPGYDFALRITYRLSVVGPTDQ